MAVFIAADAPLPLVGWNEAQPGFHVTELSGQDDEKVRSQFSKPYVYYAGAHTGCGCGFDYGRNPKYQDDVEQSRQSVASLSQYLARETASHGVIELYACWEGDQAEEPLMRKAITPEEISGESFWFEERQFLVVNPSNEREEDK
jgi:hypothetical protein